MRHIGCVSLSDSVPLSRLTGVVSLQYASIVLLALEHAHHPPWRCLRLPIFSHLPSPVLPTRLIRGRLCAHCPIGRLEACARSQKPAKPARRLAASIDPASAKTDARRTEPGPRPSDEGRQHGELPPPEGVSTRDDATFGDPLATLGAEPRPALAGESEQLFSLSERAGSVKEERKAALTSPDEAPPADNVPAVEVTASAVSGVLRATAAGAAAGVGWNARTVRASVAVTGAAVTGAAVDAAVVAAFVTAPPISLFTAPVCTASGGHPPPPFDFHYSVTATTADKRRRRANGVRTGAALRAPLALSLLLTLSGRATHSCVIPRRRPHHRLLLLLAPLTTRVKSEMYFTFYTRIFVVLPLSFIAFMTTNGS